MKYFESLVSFDNLYNAMKKAYKNENSDEGVKFRISWIDNLYKLQNKLEKSIWVPNEYRYFTIYKPKERLISQAHFEDRVVHHAYINVIINTYLSLFNENSFASLPNKGVHRARSKVFEYRKQYEYFLKTDIRHYFDNINHRILIKILKNTIKDEKLNDLECKIINNTLNKEKGLPIGNLTSQFWANIYLNEFDKFINANNLAFVRYMDDTVIFSNNENKLKKFLKEIKIFLKSTLALELKENATLLDSKNNLPFCGVTFSKTEYHLRKENRTRYIKEYNPKLQDYILGKTPEYKFISQQSCSKSVFNNLTVALGW